MALKSAVYWAKIEAPSIEEIEAMALSALRRLPEDFRWLAEDVVVRVEEFAPQEVLDNLGIADSFELMGLFQGVGLAQSGGAPSGVLPNMVFLYRRAILDYWAEHHETLGSVVTHVLVHEIGHHFGLSDEDMEKIEKSEANE
jgi:predicted Zn-dependent protease with MMP-like domain